MYRARVEMVLLALSLVATACSKSVGGSSGPPADLAGVDAVFDLSTPPPTLTHPIPNPCPGGPALVEDPHPEHEVQCNCTVTETIVTTGTDMVTTAHASTKLSLCLPPSLNTSTTDCNGFTQLSSQSQDTFYANAEQYCVAQVSTDIEAIIGTISPPYCAGISVSCTTGPPPFVNGSTCQCACASSPCDKNNCDPMKVITPKPFAIDFSQCSCTQANGCQVGSETFCMPPAGNTNSCGTQPHALRGGAAPMSLAPTGQASSGLLSHLLSDPNPIAVNHDASTAHVDVSASGFSASAQMNVRGDLTLYGRPCPGGECDMLIDLTLFTDDFTLDFGLIAGKHDVKRLSLVGGAGAQTVHVGAGGAGVIKAGQLHFSSDAFVDGSRQTFSGTNDQDLAFRVDFVGHTFAILGAPLRFSEGGADINLRLDLSGDISDEPPLAVVGPDQVVECSAIGGAQITLDGSASSDPENNIVTASWWRGHALDQTAQLGSGLITTAFAPLGTSAYELTVTDAYLATSPAHQNVTVRDTTAPAIAAPADVTVECTSPKSQAVGLTPPAVSDICDAAPRLSSDQPPLFTLGATTVTWTAVDGSGNTASATQRVVVRDTIPPALSVSAAPATIWPPNHKMVAVHITAQASDACTSPVPVTLVSATAIEPGNDEPIAATAIQGASLGTADFDVLVAAERNGKAMNGRVYTFTYDAVDRGGNHTVRSTSVTVPHDASP